MPSLEGKVALITGAGGRKGIGRATALKLAALGADIALTDVTRPQSDLPPQERGDKWQGIESVAEEVRAQEAELGFGFDYIVVCTVTGSTHAGMVVGFAKDDRQKNVIGIDASGTPEQTHAQVLDIAQKTAALVELDRDITAEDVVLRTEYAYPEYGVPSDETNDSIRMSARLEGMMTDPVYEGKSMQGMIDLVRTGFFPSGSKVLYAHLGGVPAINGYSYMYRNG